MPTGRVKIRNSQSQYATSKKQGRRRTYRQHLLLLCCGLRNLCRWHGTGGCYVRVWIGSARHRRRLRRGCLTLPQPHQVSGIAEVARDTYVSALVECVGVYAGSKPRPQFAGSSHCHTDVTESTHSFRSLRLRIPMVCTCLSPVWICTDDGTSTV